ncbi:MAG: hypothetical protein IPL08_05665 [Saprospiraceae bacterium]|nr:hypothetical protein [Saprospiraceae bacterium]
MRNSTTNALIATTTTDASAVYTFNGLAPGTSVVQAQPRLRAEETVMHDLVTGLTAPIVLSAGESNQTIDAGFSQTGKFR